LARRLAGSWARQSGARQRPTTPVASLFEPLRILVSLKRIHVSVWLRLIRVAAPLAPIRVRVSFAFNLQQLGGSGLRLL
jgi:hypothetical protein